MLSQFVDWLRNVSLPDKLETLDLGFNAESLNIFTNYKQSVTVTETGFLKKFISIKMEGEIVARGSKIASKEKINVDDQQPQCSYSGLTGEKGDVGKKKVVKSLLDKKKSAVLLVQEESKELLVENLEDAKKLKGESTLEELMKEYSPKQLPTTPKYLKTLDLDQKQVSMLAEQVAKLKTCMVRLKEVTQRHNFVEKYQENVDYLLKNMRNHILEEQRKNMVDKATEHKSKDED